MIFLELFLTFFKIGLFTFGGGYAMIPLIQSEAISRGWLSEQELINFIAVSESTPGAFAINISTYIGSIKGGFFGALCATFGVVLPSLVIIMIIARFYLKFKNNLYVSSAMSGLRPAAIALILSAVISMGASVFFANGISLSVFGSYSFIVSAAIFVIMLVLVFKKVNPIAVIGLSAVLGIASGYAEKLFIK